MSLLSFRPSRVGGAETYVRQLVAWLPRVADGDQLQLVLDRDLARTLPSPGWERVVAPVGGRVLVTERILEVYTSWRARALERLLGGTRAEVLFFPQQSIFPFRVEGPVVLTVGDMQHLIFPENFGWFDRTFRPRAYPRSMERACKVIAVSEYTQRTLVERCGLPKEKVAVVPHGFEPWETSDTKAEEPTSTIDGPYLYYPAATYAHKGHATLFGSYAVLRRRGVLTDKLVLTGEQTHLWKRRLLPLVRELGIETDVIHLGFVPANQLRQLYAGASAVLFPSCFEGFGLPVLEAVQFQRRIVTSRLEVFDEIGVPRESQIDFADPDALLTALRLPAPTRLLRPALTWRECAQKTLEVLRRAIA